MQIFYPDLVKALAILHSQLLKAILVVFLPNRIQSVWQNELHCLLYKLLEQM